MRPQRQLVDRAGRPIKDREEDSLFVEQPDDNPPEEMMAVGHMGSWTDFDLTFANPQNPGSSTGIEAGVETEKIESLADKAMRPEDIPLPADDLQDWSDSSFNSPSPEAYAALGAFRNDRGPESDEALLRPLSSMSEVAQNAPNENAKTTGTTESEAPDSWRRWTAINLVSPYICRWLCTTQEFPFPSHVPSRRLKGTGNEPSTCASVFWPVLTSQ